MPQAQDVDAVRSDLVAQLIVADDEATNIAWREFVQLCAELWPCGELSRASYELLHDLRRSPRVQRSQKGVEPDKITFGADGPTERHDGQAVGSRLCAQAATAA